MASALPPLACNGCRKCCIGDTIPLGPLDDARRFKTKLEPDGRRVLAKGKDGNCVYLGKRGCTIQSTKPVICRVFDCRVYAQRVAALPSDQQALRLDRPPVQEGARRLQALGQPVTFAGAV